MSQHVIERPVLGIGANSTFAEEVRRVERLKAERELGQRNPQANAQRRKEEQFAQYARTHPHNAFLLVWYELGAVGAAIFLLIGLALLREIRRLPPLVRTFGLATMASGTVLASLTHSLWQEWFLSGFAWCLIIFATGLTMHRARLALAAVPEEGTEPRALPT
jgi:O-antigen ligase